MSDVASVFGQWTERTIAVTGWIGEHPRDGSDVAHLLIYPTGHGAAAGMRAAAAMLGLVPADTAGDPPTVHADQASLSLTGEGWLQVHVGDSLVAERPITPDWATATRRGWAIVTMGQDGYSGRPQELDRYLSRPGRLRIGRLTVRA